MKKLTKRLLAALMAVALSTTGVLGGTSVSPAAQAAENSISGITADGVEHYLMTQGNGHFDGKLPDGRQVTIDNNSGVPTFVVGGVEYGTGITNKVSWCSSILVWPTQALAFVSAIGGTEKRGNLGVMDLKSNWNTIFWLCYDEASTSKLVTNRKVTYVAEGSVINGNGVANTKYPTSIFVSFNTFYMMFGESSTAFVVEKLLPTREELVDIYGIDPIDDATPAPATQQPATQAPTQEPRAQETVAPATQKPVEVPTMAPIPTMKPVATLPPLEVPTLGPVVAPSVAPNQIGTNFSIEWWYEKYRKGEISWEQFYQAVFGVNIDTTSHTESSTQATIDFWWEKFQQKQITWDELCQIVWGKQWKTVSEADETSTTYYVYNEDGSVAYTTTVTHSTSTSSGNENGSGTTQTTGTATETSSEKGDGGANASSTTVSDTQSHTEVQGQATVANTGYAQWSETEVGHGVISGSAISTVGDNVAGGSSKVKTKAKKVVSWSVDRPDDPKAKRYRVKLIKHINGDKKVACSVYVDTTKHIAKFDGITYKKVDRVGYTMKSRQIDLHFTNNKVQIIARAKGKMGKVFKARTLKGKWHRVVDGHGGLDQRVVNTKTGHKKGIKKAQPLKIKSRK